MPRGSSAALARRAASGESGVAAPSARDRGGARCPPRRRGRAGCGVAQARREGALSTPRRPPAGARDSRVFCVGGAPCGAFCAHLLAAGRRGAAGRPRARSRLGSFCVETVRVCLCTLGLRRLARMIRFFAVTDHFLNRQGKLKPNSTSGPRSRTSKRTSQTHTRHQKQTPQRSLICKSTHAHPRRELWSVPSLLDECSERP